MSVVIEGAEYLYKDEVAKKLGIAGTTLVVKIRAREVPLPLKLKSKSLWKLSDIEAYIESMRKGD